MGQFRSSELSFPRKREPGCAEDEEKASAASQSFDRLTAGPHRRRDDNSACEDKSVKQRVLEILDRVPDPEVPCVSVVDLGIVRDVRGGAVVITPTYTGCPATIAIARDIRNALDGAGFTAMKIETALSPPWTTDWISDEGREKLRLYGIAPPPKGAAKTNLREEAAPCPRCGSLHTEEISRFGSTPCKALHRCLDCREPFDRFKCH